MADFFTAEQIALLSASVVRVGFLVKFEFASETIRVWNGETELVVDGNTYIPLHGTGTIDGLGLSSGTNSESITLSVAGIPDAEPNILAAALAGTAEADQRLVTVYMQFMTDDWQPSGTPIPIFLGYMQPPVVNRSSASSLEGATQTVSVTAENIFYSRARPRYGRNTDRDQQARSPGDLFFRFVSSLLSKTITYPDF